MPARLGYQLSRKERLVGASILKFDMSRHILEVGKDIQDNCRKLIVKILLVFSRIGFCSKQF
jgi:hypothetical protein